MLGLSRDILSFVGICRDIGFMQTLPAPKNGQIEKNGKWNGNKAMYWCKGFTGTR